MRFFNDLGIRSKILVCSILILALVLLMGLMLYNSILAQQERERRVSHTYQVIGGADELLLQLLNMQTGVRGFVITGEPRFLQPYQNGIQEFNQIHTRLRELVGNDPLQIERLNRIDVAVQSWRTDVLSPVMLLRMTSPSAVSPAAAKIISNSIDRFDDLRKSIAEFREVETNLLASRRLESQRAAATLLSSLIIGLMLALLLSLVVSTVIANNIARRLSLVAQAATQLARGHLNERHHLPEGRDEVGRMGSAFAYMADTIRSQLLEQQRAEEALRESEERFRQLAEHIRDVFWISDADQGRILYVSPAYEEIWGRTCESLYESPLSYLDYVHPDDHERVEAAQAQKVLGSYNIEYRVVRPDGTMRWVWSRAFPVRNEHGEVYRIAGISEDITERKRAEAQVQQINAQLTSRVFDLQQRTRELMLLGDMNAMIQACLSPDEAYLVIATWMHNLFPEQVGALAVFKASQNRVEAVAMWGTSVNEQVFGPEDCWALRRGRAHLVEDPHDGVLCPHVLDHAPGGSLCLPMMARGETLGVLHVSQPAPERLSEAKQRLAHAVAGQLELALANLKLQETLRNQSIRDPLTGLFNRRYMEESLERELRRAARSGTQIGVLMIDIDFFKRFNDTFGHDAGDTLLREVGNLFQTRVRADDIVCRYGGEEFTIIMPDSPSETTMQRAQRLREMVKHLELQHMRQPLGPISVSIGVAMFPDHGVDPATLLRCADAALYRAKREGRDRVVLA